MPGVGMSVLTVAQPVVSRRETSGKMQQNDNNLSMAAEDNLIWIIVCQSIRIQWNRYWK